MGAGMKLCPKLYIGNRGVILAMSPWSYMKVPLVRVGQEAGSAPMISMSSPLILS